MSQLDIYVNYPGNCEEAFLFYEQHLNGKILMMMKHDQAPPGAVSRLSADWRKAILHARIMIGNTTIMGADIPNAESMRSAYLTLRFDNSAEAERIYHLLSDNGEIFMQMEENFFAHRFAILRDKFGTNWMLLHEK
jgi:PhnB protein